MNKTIQIKFEDLNSWEQALIHQGFEDTIGFWELKGMVSSEDRWYVSDILEKLFIYSYNTAMGFDELEAMESLDLLDGEIKAYNTILMLMKMYVKILKSGNRLWLDDRGVYVWRD